MIFNHIGLHLCNGGVCAHGTAVRTPTYVWNNKASNSIVSSNESRTIA